MPESLSLRLLHESFLRILLGRKVLTYKKNAKELLKTTLEMLVKMLNEKFTTNPFPLTKYVLKLPFWDFSNILIIDEF